MTRHLTYLWLRLCLLITMFLFSVPQRAHAQSDESGCMRGSNYYQLAQTGQRALLPAYYQFQAAEDIGCISRIAEGISATIQAFQGGTMIWFHTGPQLEGAPEPPTGTNGGFVYAVINDVPLRFAAHRDFWRNRDGVTMRSLLPAPAGLHEPWRGFRNTWAGDDALRKELGWATGEAEFYTATTVFFTLNATPSNPDFPHSRPVMLRIAETGAIYTFADPLDEFGVQVADGR